MVLRWPSTVRKSERTSCCELPVGVVVVYQAVSWTELVVRAAGIDGAGVLTCGGNERAEAASFHCKSTPCSPPTPLLPVIPQIIEMDYIPLPTRPNGPTPHASRTSPFVRRPSVRTRGVWWTLAFATVIGGIVLIGQSGKWCDYARCTPRDPFEGIVYEQRGGLLVYPGHAMDDAPQPHPIHHLIKEAQKSWTTKLARQSRTLEEAVEEYGRRYGSPPPRGFDVWFDYASQRGVQLLDEYDSIDARIRPFASLPPRILQERSEKLQHDKEFWLQDHAFTIKVKRKGGRMVMEKEGPMVGERTGQVMKLLEGFVQFLPELNLTMTGHDVPWIVLAGEARERHRTAALAGSYIDQKEYSDYAENGELDGWALICPSGSPIRDVAPFDARKDDIIPPSDTFIQTHVSAMDVCLHPSQQSIHGFTAWPGPRPGLLYPLFSFTSSSLHSDLLVPPLEQYDASVGPDPEWKDKKYAKVLWRGSTTGSDLSSEHMRLYSQRTRLCRLHNKTGSITLPTSLSDTPQSPGTTTPYTASYSTFAQEWFDFKFTGRPQQCGSSCESLSFEFSWSPHVPPSLQNEYKYVMDVDGNGWSGRFHRLLSSNSVVLKSTIFPEWYAERIAAWVHYVPISTDYHDLWTVMAFFRGKLGGEGEHDEMAERIGKEGKEWAEGYWRWEDMEAYMFRLLLEYARVMNKDEREPKGMDYRGRL